MDQLKRPAVFIIILNWNGWKDTVDCVRSCRRLNYPNYRLVVVDNASTDGSEELIRRELPDVEFLQTGANLGFAGGNNVGIRYALANGAEYVWLLNNDTVVDPEALSALVEVASADGNAGIVGSKIYYFDEPNKIWFAGGMWRTKKCFCIHRGEGEEDQGCFDAVEEVDYITGCSLLIRSDTIREIGMMEEDYFLYWEEVAWNAAAANRGWKILFVPKSLVWHKVSASLSGNPGLGTRYFIRNGLLFHQRYAWSRLLIFLKSALVDAAVFYKKGNRYNSIAILLGIRDFMLRKFGRI